MKKTGTVKKRRKLLPAVLTLLLTAALWLFPDSSLMVSHAESQGRVTANSVNIRKEPSSTSEVIGSTEKDKIITIRSQVQGTDGNTWYQTFVNSETLGYIRSDLVAIIDGTTPATEVPSTTTPTTPTPTTNNETPVEVSAVNPVSATVSGKTVNVRSNASTTSTIVKKASNGLALTVTGTATGRDGKTWYKVSFTADGAEVEGFIRSDFVNLSGELTPYEEQPEEPATSPEPETPPETPEVPEVIKDYDTSLEDGVWYLLDRQNNQKHDIKETLGAVDTNAAAYQKAEKQVKTQKGIIIVLILLLVAAVAAVTLLFFKMKDMSDAAYFSEVEKETLRRRGTASSRSQGGSQRVMHTVGAGGQTGRPAGQRSTGATQGSVQRSTGTRPAGTSQNGQRAAGTSQSGQRAAGTSQSSQRPAGARPSGTSQSSQRPSGISQDGQGARPAGTHQSGQGQRPAGARPGTSQSGQGQRSAGARPAGASQSGQGQKSAGNQQGWQSKNFMADDDDEFEFEFLNYDGDEE